MKILQAYFNKWEKRESKLSIRNLDPARKNHINHMKPSNENNVRI